MISLSVLSSSSVWLIMIALLMIFILLNCIGAAIFQRIENMTYLDSYYTVTMASTTIGFGDIAPVTNGGKMFISFFSLFMMTIYFSSITFIVSSLQISIKK